MSDAALMTGPRLGSIQQWWERTTCGQTRGLGPSLARAGLRAAAQLYQIGLRLNLGLYSSGLKARTTPLLAAVSVGNLTLGGSGKTTVVRFLAELLLKRDIMPGIVLRGYGRAGGAACVLVADGETSASSVEPQRLASLAEAGDEACMLAEALPGVPVAVGKRRELAIRLLAERTGAQIALLDDGFQYFRMRKLCDIVLIDAAAPLTGERLFPAGHLREPLRHLGRADQIWITHADHVSPEHLASLHESLAAVAPEIPIVVSRHGLARLDLLGGGQIGPADLAGRRVLAVCGIGNPRSFEASLEQAGADVVPLRYADHHPYCTADLEYIARAAQSERVDLIACTRKDAVKWPPADWPLPVVVVDCQLQILAGGESLDSVVERVRRVVTTSNHGQT